MKKKVSKNRALRKKHSGDEVIRYIEMFAEDCMCQLSDLEYFMKNSTNVKKLVRK